LQGAAGAGLAAFWCLVFWVRFFVTGGARGFSGVCGSRSPQPVQAQPKASVPGLRGPGPGHLTLYTLINIGVI
jgi:hypothetical protein